MAAAIGAPSAVHGVRALRVCRGEGERRGSGESEGESKMRDSDGSKSRRGEGRGAWHGGRRAVLSMAAMGHCVKHVARGEVGKVGAELGHLRVNLDLGPKANLEPT